MKKLKAYIEAKLPFYAACIVSVSLGSIASHYAREYSPAIFMICGYYLPATEKLAKKLLKRKG